MVGVRAGVLEGGLLSTARPARVEFTECLLKAPSTASDEENDERAFSEHKKTTNHRIALGEVG